MSRYLCGEKPLRVLSHILSCLTMWVIEIIDVNQCKSLLKYIEKVSDTAISLVGSRLNVFCDIIYFILLRRLNDYIIVKFHCLRLFWGISLFILFALYC